MKRQLFSFLSLLIALSMLLASCASPAQPQATTASSGQSAAGEYPASPKVDCNKPVTIGVSYASLDIQFFQFYQKGIREAAKKYCAKLIEMDSFYDPEKQLANIESIISQKPDALIIHPVDETAVVPGVEAANKAGIPVFGLDRPPKGGKLDVYLSAGHDVIGPMQAEFIAKQLNGKGNVVLVQGPLGESYTRKLDSGIKKVFSEKYPDIKIIDEQSAGGWDRAKALSIMEDMIQKHGKDINAVIATADMLAMGAAEALKNANMMQNVKMVAADGDLDMLQGIKKGEISGTVDPQPYESGAIAARTAILLALKQQIPGLKDVNGTPTLEVPMLLVTKDNVDQTPEWGVVPLN